MSEPVTRQEARQIAMKQAKEIQDRMDADRRREAELFLEKHPEAAANIGLVISAAHSRGVREGLLKAAELLEQKYGDTPGAVPYSGLRDIRRLAAEQREGKA